jgi:hypothetical protein
VESAPENAAEAKLLWSPHHCHQGVVGLWHLRIGATQAPEAMPTPPRSRNRLGLALIRQAQSLHGFLVGAICLGLPLLGVICLRRSSRLGLPQALGQTSLYEAGSKLTCP